MHPEKINGVTSLDPAQRYEYLIKRAADFEEVWIVEDEERKLLTMGDPDETVVIPVWPEEGFAQLFLQGDWKGYHAVMISLEDFLEMLDQFAEDGVQMAGFPAPEGATVIVSAAEMKAHLLEECKQYE